MNEEIKYRQLKESFRMMKSQRSNVEKNKLIESDKRMGIDEIIKQNERINNNLKSQIYIYYEYFIKQYEI